MSLIVCPFHRVSYGHRYAAIPFIKVYIGYLLIIFVLLITVVVQDSFIYETPPHLNSAASNAALRLEVEIGWSLVTAIWYLLYAVRFQTYTDKYGGMLLCGWLPPALHTLLPVYSVLSLGASIWPLLTPPPLPTSYASPVYLPIMCSWLGISSTVSLCVSSPPVVPAACLESAAKRNLP